MIGIRHDLQNINCYPDDEMPMLGYGKDVQGRWWVRPPGCDSVFITGHGEGKDWKVVEHSDRTITVTPSLFYNPPSGWHGFLTNGNWITC